MKTKRAEEIIAAARRAQRCKLGERRHVRLPHDLAARAMACANDVGDGLGDWVSQACASDRFGMFTGVAIDEKTLLATRKGSESITLRAPKKMHPHDILSAVAKACAYCEARRVVFNPQKIHGFLFDGKQKKRTSGKNRRKK